MRKRLKYCSGAKGVQDTEEETKGVVAERGRGRDKGEEKGRRERERRGNKPSGTKVADSLGDHPARGIAFSQRAPRLNVQPRGRQGAARSRGEGGYSIPCRVGVVEGGVYSIGDMYSISCTAVVV